MNDEGRVKTKRQCIVLSCLYDPLEAYTLGYPDLGEGKKQKKKEVGEGKKKVPK